MIVFTYHFTEFLFGLGGIRSLGPFFGMSTGTIGMLSFPFSRSLTEPGHD
ncbi:hypothetical protein NCCP133_07260 [Cytobacillus sp. NCCP-133]|nr:hypothetical protein NCCP133_07260 [Cytobacillus sp. NCCP-133]